MARRRRSGRVARVAATLALAYVALCAVAWALQARLVFFPTPAGGPDPWRHGLAFEDVRIPIGEGVEVHAWWVPREDARATVVFCHGNAGNLHHRLGTVRALHGLGLAVLLFDYPGYGASDGSPTESGCVRAALAAVRHVRAVRDPERVVLWGRSLGGAVAAAAADEVPVDALVLESTFTSLVDRAAEAYPFLPVRLLLRMRFETEARLERLDVPVLILHGRDDTVVPFAHGERLHAASPRSRLVALDGGHDDAFLVDAETYAGAVREFLADH